MWHETALRLSNNLNLEKRYERDGSWQLGERGAGMRLLGVSNLRTINSKLGGRYITSWCSIPCPDVVVVENVV
jgi:hypothetical protein